MTHREIAEVVAAELVIAKQQAELAGRTFRKSDIVPVVERILTAHAYVARKRRKNAPKEHARDEIFDLLAKCDGVLDTKQLTRHGASKVAGAKKQILEVMRAGNPEVTTADVVREIEKRWARYCRKYTEKRMQTAMALVGHWGEFADPDSQDRRRTHAEQMNIYVEPENWRPAMAAACGVDPEALVDKNWLDIGVDHRMATLKHMMRTRGAA